VDTRIALTRADAATGGIADGGDGAAKGAAIGAVQHESEEFWPIYRAYRSEVDKATDQVVELVLEYADQYPVIPEEKAREMLEQYLKVEARLVKLKEKYLKKIGKVIPAPKVFRFAQVDNRLDLATRVGIASALPILGTDKAAPAKQN